MSTEFSIIKSDESLNEFSEVANAIEKYATKEDDANLEYILDRVNKNPSLLTRLFPSKIQKEYDKLSIDHMKSLFQSKSELLKVYNDIKLQIAKKQGDALIAAVGMHLQDKLATIAAEKINSVQDTLEKSRERHMIRMQRQYDAVKSYTNSESKEMFLKSLKNEEITYFKTVQEILDGFINSLKTKLVN